MSGESLEQRSLAVATAITEYFLQHDDACTVKELAAHMQRSEAWVRKVLNETHGCPRGCVVADGQREKFSASYPSMSAGHQRVNTYQPTLSTLRDLVLKLRSP